MFVLLVVIITSGILALRRCTIWFVRSGIYGRDLYVGSLSLLGCSTLAVWAKSDGVAIAETAAGLATMVVAARAVAWATAGGTVEVAAVVVVGGLVVLVSVISLIVAEQTKRSGWWAVLSTVHRVRFKHLLMRWCG